MNQRNSDTNCRARESWTAGEEKDEEMRQWLFGIHKKYLLNLFIITKSVFYKQEWRFTFLKDTWDYFFLIFMPGKWIPSTNAWFFFFRFDFCFCFDMLHIFGLLQEGRIEFKIPYESYFKRKGGEDLIYLNNYKSRRSNYYL